MNHRWISHNEIALKLGISRQTVVRLIKAKKIPGEIRYFGARRMERSAFEQWLLSSDPAQPVL
jgi:excisionase family DNA binding protein